MVKENQIYNDTSLKEEISLKDLILKMGDWFRFLWSKWLIILVFGLLGGGLGFIYASLKKTIYIATTTFVLEDEQSGGGGLGNLAGLASMAGVDLTSGGGIFQGDNLLQLYKSRKMIEQTLLTKVDSLGKKQLLVDFYITSNNLRESWNKNDALKDLTFSSGNLKDSIVINGSLIKNFSRVQDSVLGVIVKDINRNYLVVDKVDKKSGIIKVEVVGRDEHFSKVFNEQLVKNVNKFYLQTKTKKLVDNVVILQEKTDSVRAVMNGAIYSVATTTDATPNLNPTRQVQRVAPVQQAQFSVETNKLVLSSLVQNLEMSKVALKREAPLIQIIDEPIYPLQKERLGKSKAMLIGGILFSFFIVFLLSFKLFLKNVLLDE